jgi:hypothetical protein
MILAIAAIFSYIDAIVIGAFSFALVNYYYLPTKSKLFTASSAVDYWREGRGATKDDYFDASLPLERCRRMSTTGKRMAATLKHCPLTHTYKSLEEAGQLPLGCKDEMHPCTMEKFKDSMKAIGHAASEWETVIQRAMSGGDSVVS